VLGEEWELFYPEHLWYFDRTTLRRLLEAVGYTIISSGSRDFDPLGKSLSELLFRLGLKKRGNAKNADFSLEKNHDSSKKMLSQAPQHAPLSSWIIAPLRFLLAKIVQWSGRADSFWIIAQKPS
jgi:hypothetical protein